MTCPVRRRTSPTSFKSEGKTTTVNGQAIWPSQKSRKGTGLGREFKGRTFPVTHLVSPTCCLASATGRQSEAAIRVAVSRMTSATRQSRMPRFYDSEVRQRESKPEKGWEFPGMKPHRRRNEGEAGMGRTGANRLPQKIRVVYFRCTPETATSADVIM